MSQINYRFEQWVFHILKNDFVLRVTDKCGSCLNFRKHCGKMNKNSRLQHWKTLICGPIDSMVGHCLPLKLLTGPSMPWIIWPSLFLRLPYNKTYLKIISVQVHSWKNTKNSTRRGCSSSSERKLLWADFEVILNFWFRIGMIWFLKGSKSVRLEYNTGF